EEEDSEDEDDEEDDEDEVEETTEKEPEETAEEPEEKTVTPASDEAQKADQATKDMINKSFRIMYAELSKLFENAGEQAPDTITELIQKGTQKGVFSIDGLHDALTIKKKVRRNEPITEHEKNLVLKIVNQLID
ncbi:hypothetical protein GOV10_06110, partial [Candidatus Woesearchaeota archaeon]|nr:hypothetical protein [Candidatus Woesearchaeota archaeon]